MKAIPTSALVLALIVGTVGAQAETLQQLTMEWRAINAAPRPNFAPLIPRLEAYREGIGGKKWEVDYLLGSSYCTVPGQEKKGTIALGRVLANFSATDEARKDAEQVISNCGRRLDKTASEPSDIFVAVRGQTGGAILRNKGGYEVDPKTTPGGSTLHPSPVALAELQQRIFSPDQSGAAVYAALARLNDPLAHAAAKDGFVVTSRELPPDYTSDCLNRYRHPLESEFKMQFPSSLITVYTVDDPAELLVYARQLHGVDLPFGTVAYSVYEDLSMVGSSGFDGRPACGSLAHELVHLGIRQNFGDSPAWLEEGIAEEVAVAVPMLSKFIFPKSWRDDMLIRYWRLRPTVSQLLNKNWGDYAATNLNRVDQVAALDAMTAVFIRYMDSKGKLVPVYFAVRNSLSSATPLSDQEILESSLGMSLDQIDSDFVRWFGYKLPIAHPGSKTKGH